MCICTPNGVYYYPHRQIDKTFLWKLNNYVLKVYCIIRLQIFTGEKKKNFYFIADDICLFILVKLKCLEKQD